MAEFSVWHLLTTGGFAVVLALMIWVLVDLTRLRRHPAFRSAFSGSLRLHLMALGMSAQGLDDPTRRRILSLRRRILAAVLVFAAAGIGVAILAPGTVPVP